MNFGRAIPQFFTYVILRYGLKIILILIFTIGVLASQRAYKRAKARKEAEKRAHPVDGMVK